MVKSELLVLGLGSNIEPREIYLQKAVEKLDFLSGIKVSSTVDTPAMLAPNSPTEWDKPFLNIAVAGWCNLDPIEIFNKIKEIEVSLGRPSKHPKWSPRTIDVDILAYGQLRYQDEYICIPHPELFNRSFAYLPAMEIAADLISAL